MVTSVGRRAIVVFIAGLLAIPLLSIGVSANELTPRERRVARIAKPFVRVGHGQREVIEEGDVIQQGTKEGEFCHYDEKNTVGFAVPDDIGPVAYHIVLGQDDDCDIVVEAAEPIKPPEDEPRTNPISRRGGAVSHRMWAFHTVFEYVNITTSEERVKLTYDRDGGQVFNGRDKFRYSYVDSQGVWSTDHQAQNSDLNGPTEVFYYSRTRYWSSVPPQPDYALSARATADPGPRHSCSFSQGDLPFGWDRECSGGLFY
jgi:hypothetical protein